MLNIQNISKQYKTGDFIQVALNNVSLNLRDSEFVAILGPSGSGKTTLLNIIGGLDQYDSGNLIINGVSTKDYKDRDWDSYRNHTVGFVFQSYNLIPHQSVLSNVELALTISGMNKSERKEKAIKALEQVGLDDHVHKKPNQLSGGQMQRVAIARALVNDPDILLADEPTGALDSETSVQIMELLKEVAKDRLVVMVTHNPELAVDYATRIVKLKDGVILEDNNPYEIEENIVSEHKNLGKSSMSLKTALYLSFNNLKTKKSRTFLTSFAGSIGIIGIALIMSISNGVNTYIDDIQKDTMTSYPISIQEQSIDLTSIMNNNRDVAMDSMNVDHELNAVYSNHMSLEMASNATSNIATNNLTEFKKYLDDPKSPIHKYVGENGIVYSFSPKFDVYSYDKDDTLVKASTTNESAQNSPFAMAGMGSMMQSGLFSELIPDEDGLISSAITDSYDVVYGNWPTQYNEIVMVLGSTHEISLQTLSQLGYYPAKDYEEILSKIGKGEEVDFETISLSYEEICNQEFYLIPQTDYYKLNDNDLYADVSNSQGEVKELLKTSLPLKITGVVKLNEDASSSLITSTIGYTQALTNHLIDYVNESDIVKAQVKSSDINVLNGVKFSPSNDKDKIEDAKNYLNSLNISDKAALTKDIMQTVYATNPTMLATMMNQSEENLAKSLDRYLENPDDNVLLNIYDNYISSGTLEENLKAFGVVSLDAPSAISIYTDSFENKENITQCIDDYNTGVSEENKITYTDTVGMLMSSITTIIDVISYVLIAFVAVSLIVSSIMIGIITYISVLERTKEIGILRAIGASKSNISQVFNAETFIIGALSGIIGIVVTLILLIPGNAIIHVMAQTTDVNGSLPIPAAIILVILSICLTLIGGIIPARKAAKQDPVTALRSD